MKHAKLLIASLLLCAHAHAGNYVGDYNVGDTIDCKATSVNPSTGAPVTLAGSPAVAAYVDNSTTEITAGVTLTTDFDSRTGYNNVRIVASGGNGFAAGTFVSMAFTAGTANSVSVVGYEVCSFTLRKGTITGIPAATAGATGGIQIAGSNAATTYASLTVTGTTTLSDGLVVSRSTSNSPAATFTGNGTGNGVTITSGSGATGTGLALVAASTNGAALTAAGTGTGNGATFTSGSGATGNGAQFTAASTNGNGIGLTATGSGVTMTITPSNVQQFGGSAGTFASGRPETNMTHIAGSSVSTSTAQLGVNVVNFGGSAGTFASGRPETNVTHWTGSSLTTGTGPLPGLGILDRGDLQSDSTTANQIRSAATFADSELIGATNLLYSATTGAGQRCMVSANVGSTDTLTCSPALTTDPTGTVRYELYGTGAASGAGGSLTASDVWTYGTRTVTAATNITSTGGTIPITSSRVDASVGAYQTGLTPLQPTTAGRTLDVTSTGEAGIDWANIGSPTTTVNLSGTSTKALEPTVASRTLDVSSTGEAGVDWANVGSPTTTVNLSGTTISTTQAVASVSGNVGGNVTGSVGSVATGGITAASIAADAITSSELATSAVDELVDATWDEAKSGHTTAGTFGFYLDSAISGVSTGGVSAATIADAVWDEDMTAHQTQGSSGQVLGDSVSDSDTLWGLANSNLDATVSSRASSASIAALPNQIRDITVEDMGGGVTSACVQAVLLSFAAGDIVTSGGTTTWKDPSNGETRITSTVTSAGNRTATITCPTLP